MMDFNPNEYDFRYECRQNCGAYKQGKADAIDECIKTITDYCGGLPNNNLINELEKLKE